MGSLWRLAFHCVCWQNQQNIRKTARAVVWGQEEALQWAGDQGDQLDSILPGPLKTRRRVMELSYPRSQELEHASAVHQLLSNTSWELRGGIGSLHVKLVLNNTGWAFFWGLRKSSKGQMDIGGTLTAHTTGHNFTVRMTSLVLPNTEESMQFLIMDTIIITRNRQNSGK